MVPEAIQQRAAAIRMVLMDCDGVLTDGRLYYSFDGAQVTESLKVFHIHDGQGLRLASLAGLKLGIITGRSSPALIHRAEELGIEHLHQSVSDKLTIYNQIKLSSNLADNNIAYIGDDLPDLPPMRRCGLAVAVRNAVLEVRSNAHYVTRLRGGMGAVRETIDLLLKAQGKWEFVLDRFNR